MVSCEDAFKWLERLKKTYQPVEGYIDKIDPKRVEGFNRILDTFLAHCGDVSGKRFLDLGCNFGWFCLELAKRGAVTVGVERDVWRSRVSTCMAERLGLENVTFFNCDAPEFVAGIGEGFDYVILLNVFHHILVPGEAEGWGMFNRLIDSSEGVFVMMRNQLKGWSLCGDRLGIPDAVVDASHASGYVAYPPVHGRVIYFFYRD